MISNMSQKQSNLETTKRMFMSGSLLKDLSFTYIKFHEMDYYDFESVLFRYLEEKCLNLNINVCDDDNGVKSVKSVKSVKTRVRRATMDDITRITEVARLSFIETYGPLTDDQESYMQSFYNDRISRKWVTDDGLVTLVSIDDSDNAVGFAIVVLPGSSMESGVVPKKRGEIGKLYILQKEHGKGRGRELMTACEDVCRQHKIHRLYLGVYQGNTNAIQFYRHMGFKQKTQPMMFRRNGNTVMNLKMQKRVKREKERKPTENKRTHDLTHIKYERGVLAKNGYSEYILSGFMCGDVRLKLYILREVDEGYNGYLFMSLRHIEGDILESVYEKADMVKYLILNGGGRFTQVQKTIMNNLIEVDI